MNTVHLQGIGKAAAVKAEELKPGMLLSWNYAPNEYEVVSVCEVSPKFVELTERNRKTGQQYTRRFKKDRLIAAEMPKS